MVMRVISMRPALRKAAKHQTLIGFELCHLRALQSKLVTLQEANGQSLLQMGTPPPSTENQSSAAPSLKCVVNGPSRLFLCQKRLNKQNHITIASRTQFHEKFRMMVIHHDRKETLTIIRMLLFLSCVLERAALLLL